jgi:tRNA (adenine57-N1/adenine58-N1)-methyltransferase catalytic subunit
MSDLFQAGDKVQLTGPKGRLNTLTLVAGGRFGSHKGDLMHDDIIGQPQGSVIANQSGVEYLALKPLLTDYVLSMPRGAAIVYPKDAGQIIVEGDIFPGATVVEAGVGSGALSNYLLRAIGPQGKLYSFEKREEFAQIAQGNVANQMGSMPENWQVLLGELQQELPKALEQASVDRVVLDMLAPWECIEAVADALKPGGLVIVYVATVTQLSRTIEAIRDHEGFTDPNAWESMVRSWHVEGLAVRPDHRMIAHTGFLLSARRLAPGAQLPQFKQKRASKTDFTQADMDTWLPDAIGQRPISEKKLRKTVRKVALEQTEREN